jgi:hypothetical protein
MNITTDCLWRHFLDERDHSRDGVKRGDKLEEMKISLMIKVNMYIPMVSMLLLVTIVGAKKSLFEAIRAKGKGIAKAQDNQYDGSPSIQGVVSPSGDVNVDLGVPSEMVDADAFKWLPELHKKDEAAAPGWSHDSLFYNQFLTNGFPPPSSPHDTLLSSPPLPLVTAPIAIDDLVKSLSNQKNGAGGIIDRTIPLVSLVMIVKNGTYL